MRDNKGQFIKGHKAIPISKEGRIKISLTHKGKKKSAEMIRKLKENHVGTTGKKLFRSKEHQDKINNARLGKHYPKISESHKGSKNPSWKGGKEEFKKRDKIKRKIKYISDREKLMGRKIPKQCEICGSMGTICFDHDHKTDKPRGWICRRCNLALGLVKDNIETLKEMVNYLKSWLKETEKV